MEKFIVFIISNFTLTFFVLGIMISVLILLFKRKTGVIEAFFVPFLFCSIGLSFFYNFVMHVFFGETAAHFGIVEKYKCFRFSWI